MYLVTGASGKLGRGVIDSLIAEQKIPPNQIIAITRKPEGLGDLAAKGVQVRAGSFDDEAGLAKAFAGAKRLLIISTDALGEPGLRLAQHKRAVAAAEKAGVEHVLYTSLPNAERSQISFAPDHLGTEEAIAAGKFKGWTILRNNWYYENLFYSLPHAIASGTLYTAAGEGKIAHLARADLARAAAAALAAKDTGKKTYTLSGSVARSTAEIARLVSAAVGKPIKVVQVPLEGLIKGMTGSGMPEALARVFASFDASIAAGELSGNSADYKALSGKEPQDFESWLKANAGALVAASQKAA
jgi:NAD(P)H dehydrogenase (quinone)